jgi:hypothetical protein
VRAKICYSEPIFSQERKTEARDIIKLHASSVAQVRLPEDHIIRYFPRELVNDPSRVCNISYIFSSSPSSPCFLSYYFSVSQEFTESAAAYQFGVLIHEMMSKKYPYQHIKTMKDFLEEVVSKARLLTQYVPFVYYFFLLS